MRVTQYGVSGSGGVLNRAVGRYSHRPSATTVVGVSKSGLVCVVDRRNRVGLARGRERAPGRRRTLPPTHTSQDWTRGPGRGVGVHASAVAAGPGCERRRRGRVG